MIDWSPITSSAATAANRAGTTKLGRPVVSAKDLLGGIGLTYRKGRTVLGMFEQWLGPEVFRRFNRDEATLERKRETVLWYYRALADEFRRGGPARLAGELERVVAEVERLAAFLLDSLIIGAVAFLLFLAPLLLDVSGSWAVFNMLAFVVRIFYFPYFEHRWQGRTPGKRWLGFSTTRRTCRIPVA